jgi:peptide/nickel transport system ATP-binding protein
MVGVSDQSRTGGSSDRQLLNVRALRVFYGLGDTLVRAVDDVSLQLATGETLGLVGESGCGKTTLALALLRVLPPNGRIMGGQVCLNGVDLLQLSDAEMRRVRWKEISMIFQGAMNSLNPVYRISDFLAEAVRAHEPLTIDAMRERVARVLDLAGFPPGRRASYPHELSGGMKQRAVIALSLVCNPKIVIADEPTTALDVVVQDLILRRLKTIQRDLDLAMILVSHDASIVAQVCDRVAVMYAGQIVEYADVRRIFKDPRNPYTIGLMSSVPSLVGPQRRLTSIPGVPPDLRMPPVGCRFANRCPIAQEVCVTVEPPLVPVSDRHWSRCHFATDSRVLHLQHAELGWASSE